jgi:GT2 family glycosyltransferase
MVGILLVLFDDQKNIPVISNALRNLTYKDYRLYAIDNHPDTPSSSNLQKELPSVKIIPSFGNIGFAKGNNLLAEEAISEGCDYLWVLNPDMEPEPVALEMLIDFMEKRPEAGMSGPLLLLGNTKDQPTIQLFGSNANYRTQKKKEIFAGIKLNEILLPSVIETDLLNAGSLIIRSEIVRGSYLFEEMYFMYNDEIDLARRVREKGYKLYVLSGSKVWHHHDWASENSAGYNLMYYYMMRNRILYFRKYSLFVNMWLDIFKQIIVWPLILRFSKKISGFALFRYYYLGLFHGIMNRKGRASFSF